jgi:hypothetical protein
MRTQIKNICSLLAWVSLGVSFGGGFIVISIILQSL